MLHHITSCRWNQPTAPDRNLLILKHDAVLATHRSRDSLLTSLLQPQASAFDVRHIERELRARLTDWRGLLGRHTPIARQMLVTLLDGRVVFTPKQDGLYAFHGRAALGKVLQGLVPQVFEPRGVTLLTVTFRGVVAA